MRRAIPICLSALCVLSGAAAWSSAGDVKAAAQRVSEVFEGTHFTAKVDLLRYQHYYVTPEGHPHPGKGKKQGRGNERGIQLDSGVKVRAGERGYTIGVVAKEKDEVWVFFNQKPKAKVNPAIVHVLYDRPVTADDLTPERIARAVDSLVVIHGYEPGAEVAAAIDEVLQAGADAVQAVEAPAPGPARPTVASLTVRAEPPTVWGGDEVQLILEYSVEAPHGAVVATETRSLTLDGVAMPTFPAVESIERTAGAYVSSYRQRLPATVSPGTYVLDGEVCVEGECIRRRASFEVVPR